MVFLRLIPSLRNITPRTKINIVCIWFKAEATDTWVSFIPPIQMIRARYPPSIEAGSMVFQLRRDNIPARMERRFGWALRAAPVNRMPPIVRIKVAHMIDVFPRRGFIIIMLTAIANMAAIPKAIPVRRTFRGMERLFFS